MAYEDKYELHAAAIVGCAISLFFCILALAAFVFFRPRTESFAIKKHLTAAVGLTQLILLLGNAAYKKEVGCQVLTVLLHYVATACFTWSSVDALYLYFSLANRFHPLRKSWCYLCFGWAGTIQRQRTSGKDTTIYYTLFHCLPVVVLILTPVVGFTAEPGKKLVLSLYTCWSSDHVVWTFVIPSLLIATVNVVILSMTLHQLWQPSYDLCAKSVMEKKATKYGLRTNSLMVLGMCLAWVFGIFSFRDVNNVGYQLSFGLLNGLQGIFLFFFHCVLNLDIKGYYETGVHRCNHEDGCFKTESKRSNRTASRLQEHQTGSRHKIGHKTHVEDAPLIAVDKDKKEQGVSSKYVAESTAKGTSSTGHVILDAETTPESTSKPCGHSSSDCEVVTSLPGTPEPVPPQIEVKSVQKKSLPLDLTRTNSSPKNGAVRKSATLAAVVSPVSPMVEEKKLPSFDRLKISDNDESEIKGKYHSEPMISPREEKDSQHAIVGPPRSEPRKLSVQSSTPSPGSERKHRKSSRHHGSSLNELESLFSNPSFAVKPRPSPVVHGNSSTEGTHSREERLRKVSSSDSVKDALFFKRSSLGDTMEGTRRASGQTQETML